MDKVRVRDLAKELGMETSKEVLAFLERIGVKGKSASSNLEGEMIDRVRNHFRKPAPPPPPPRTTTLTRSDGVLERRSQKVVLRRGSPTPGGSCRAGGSTSALSGSASTGSRRGYERRRAGPAGRWVPQARNWRTVWPHRGTAGRKSRGGVDGQGSRT